MEICENRSSSAANPPHSLQRDSFKGTNQLLTNRELWNSLLCGVLFHNDLWEFVTLLLLMRSFPGTTRDPGLGVGSRGRTLQCPDMSRALLCHVRSTCLFFRSPESLKWGVTPSRNPTMQAPERMDALIQKPDFLCWQTLASSFLLRSEADSFPQQDHRNPPLCQVRAHPCSGWQG